MPSKLGLILTTPRATREEITVMTHMMRIQHKRKLLTISDSVTMATIVELTNKVPPTALLVMEVSTSMRRITALFGNS